MGFSCNIKQHKLAKNSPENYDTRMAKIEHIGLDFEEFTLFFFKSPALFDIWFFFRIGGNSFAQFSIPNYVVC